MKRIALIAAIFATGCAARGSQMYHDDTAKMFELKQADMKGCYNNVLKTDAAAQGTVAVKFSWEKSSGKLMSLAVDPAGTTAPAPVQECVKKGLEGLVINPADQREGQGTWTFEFKAGAAAPAAAAAAPAPAAATPAVKM
jgi:hypothetical protein